MKNDDAGRNESGWSALQDLDAARTGLEGISGLAWLSKADAADTAGLIKRTYEVYPELDLVVSQQALAERIVKFADSVELPLDDRLFLILLARTIDPHAAGLTEKAVALAIQARAWEIVGELVDGSPLPEDPAGSVVFGEASPSDGLTGVTRLVSHFVRNPSASMWRIGEQLGEEIDGIAPVEPGTRVTEDPWHTAALFVQGRNLIKTRSLLAPRGQSALANPAAFVASARRSIDAVLPRSAPLDASRRPGRERVTGVVRWADVICDQEAGTIPARLLSSEHGRRDEAGAIRTDRPTPGRIAYGPFCKLAPGHYTAGLIGRMSGRSTLHFAVMSESRTFAMVSVVVEESDLTEARSGVCELATCSFILPEPKQAIEFVVETITVSGILVITAVDLRRALDPASPT